MTSAYVVTTIQEPTEGVRLIATHCLQTDSPFYVIGDRKTPRGWECAGAQYFGFGEDPAGDFAIARLLRPDSYTRKMLGYLAAATSGAAWIRETDDDNSPYPSFFESAPMEVRGRRLATPSRFVNIYGFFTNRHVWPRGFPLRLIRESTAHAGTEITDFSGPMVFQAVADGDPDVDAVYRLTAPDTSDVQFDLVPPLIIEPGSWAPFNSQATTWPVDMLPLMYLPATCSFRMTDIWRSYIAQRLFPGLGARLVVTSPTVFQDRNEHDLMRDFQEEIEGYTGYERFVDVISATEIGGTSDLVLDDLRLLYSKLIDAGFFSYEELIILDAWIADMMTLGFGPSS